jgi:hypothetical protein
MYSNIYGVDDFYLELKQYLQYQWSTINIELAVNYQNGRNLDGVKNFAATMKNPPYSSFNISLKMNKEFSCAPCAQL